MAEEQFEEQRQQDLEQYLDSCLIDLDSIQETQVEWLFSWRVPRGEITIFAGDGGAGKTGIVCSIVAAVSSGKRSIFDEADNIPEEYVSNLGGRKVLFFSSEDDFSKVLKHRQRCV